jgi:hypothetical protein
MKKGACPLHLQKFPYKSEVNTNRNAPCDYTYTGSIGKEEVTLELSYILRKLLIAFHVT